MSEAFFDTNILLYLLSGDDQRRAVSVEIQANGGVISVQVLNEFVAVARGKYALDWDELEAMLDDFRSHFQVESLTPPVQARAVHFARRYRIRIYDANILAVAENAGCSIVYSEDMQHGQAVAGLTIRNPFLTA